MDTLGYKESINVTKVQVATIHLVEAITLFTNEKFLPSLTLAGAAEEVLAGLLRTRGKEPSAEEAFRRWDELRCKLGLKSIQIGSRKNAFRSWNNARNSIKHHDSSDEEAIVLNDCDEAYWMIRRALKNAERLSVRIPNEHDFENWIIEKVCL